MSWESDKFSKFYCNYNYASITYNIVTTNIHLIYPMILKWSSITPLDIWSSITPKSNIYS